jgi:hypothetical protein
LPDQPRCCLRGHRARELFARAKFNLGGYTDRRQKEAFDTINALTMQAVAGRAFSSPPQRDAARRRAVETWLPREGLIARAEPK